MKVLLLLAIFATLLLVKGDSCGGCCPSDDCPSGDCPCGTSENVLGPGDMVSALSGAGFNGSDLSNILCICQCESSNDSNAVNYNGGNNPPTWDTGLCQINDVNWDTNLNPNAVCANIVSSQTDLCDANTNAQCAYAIFQESGFQPWSADARCGCNVLSKEDWETYKQTWNLD